MLYLESQRGVGDTGRVEFYRDGQRVEVTLTLAERPEQL